MTIENSLISFFTSTDYNAKDIAALIGSRAHLNKIPKSQANKYPRIFLRRSSKSSMGDLDGSGQGDYLVEDFDLEVISNDHSEVYQITDLLWSDVNLTMGNITSSKQVKGIFVDNQGDDYESKGIAGDIGVDVANFSLRVIHDTTTT